MWKFNLMTSESNQRTILRLTKQSTHSELKLNQGFLHSAILLSLIFSLTCHCQLGLNELQPLDHQTHNQPAFISHKTISDEPSFKHQSIITSSSSQLELEGELELEEEEEGSYSSQLQTIHELTLNTKSNSQLETSPIIFHDQQDSFQTSDSTSSNIESHEPDQRPLDSSPLRYFFSGSDKPSQSNEDLVLEGSIGHAEPDHNRAKRWLQPRDNVNPPPSYPGTDTVYATKTVFVTPGQPQYTPNPGSPTVVVILQGNLSGPPQPSAAVNTITLDKSGHPGPFTTTIYPPGMAVATVTVLSSANTNFDPNPAYRSICYTLIFSSIGFMIGFLHLL